MQTEFRRKAPRRRFDGNVGSLFQGKMTLTQCSQLGEGGALIHCEGDLERVTKGDQMVLTIFLPNIGGIIATAECVYIADSGKVGLQFQTLDTLYKKRIREFVSRRKAQEVA